MDQLKALLAACEGKEFVDRRDKAIVLLLLDAVLRRGEVSRVKLADLDVKARNVRIAGRHGRVRLAPFGVQACRAVEQYLQVRARHPQAGDEALWLGERGQLTEKAIDTLIRRRGAQAGVENVHAQRLRHTLPPSSLWRMVERKGSSCNWVGGAASKRFDATP